jgi:hypothetical protein
MNRPVSEIDAYLEGTLTAEQAQTLEAWINASPDHAAEFLFLIQTHQTLGIIGKESQLARHAAEVKPDQLDRVTLAALADMEASAETITLPIHDFIRFDQPEADDDAGSLSAHDLVAAGSYLFRHSFTPKVVAAVAAVLIVGITLLIALSGDTPARPIAEDSSEPDQADRSFEPPVATLTASGNAQWDGPASAGLALGDTLVSGQRLTLTAGLAEITTSSGAVAIIEAPVTFQLINSNALHLHTGKLVGICETDASKGFLVRTPHMDITDLGTRFGIDADSNATEVHVFDGEVQAERVDAAADTQPVTLVANQSARTSADTDVIARIDHDAEAFAALLPTTTQLPGTGHGLAVGEADPNWQIVAIDGQPLDTAQQLRVTSNGNYNSHFPNDPATSQFIAWNPPSEPPVGGFTAYTFRTQLTLPNDLDPAEARLAIRFMADNQLAAMVVNGQQVAVRENLFGGHYDHWVDLVVADHLAPGVNTIDVEVRNHLPEGDPSARAVGLRLTWQLYTGQAESEGASRQP